jgi:hypothetical protein
MYSLLRLVCGGLHAHTDCEHSVVFLLSIPTVTGLCWRVWVCVCVPFTMVNLLLTYSQQELLTSGINFGSISCSWMACLMRRHSRVFQISPCLTVRPTDSSAERIKKISPATYCVPDFWGPKFAGPYLHWIWEDTCVSLCPKPYVVLKMPKIWASSSVLHIQLCVWPL